MLNVEIRFVVDGEEVSLDSFAEIFIREVRSCVREELSHALSRPENKSRESQHETTSQASLQAISIREAARLLSISPRTVHKYVALRVIRTVRVGRRVLIPMKSVNEIAARGIPRMRGD